MFSRFGYRGGVKTQRDISLRLLVPACHSCVAGRSAVNLVDLPNAVNIHLYSYI